MMFFVLPTRTGNDTVVDIIPETRDSEAKLLEKVLKAAEKN
jgi:hypothetical protein